MSNQNKESEIYSFLGAVNYLFHSNDKALKEKANKYLIEFESKPESLDISYKVLLEDNLPEEVYYNALNIIKNKIKFDFGNYSENPKCIEEFFTFFFNNINRFKKAKNYILINYCDCIGKALLFTGDKFNSFLKNFTMNLFGQNSDIDSLVSLLLIFNSICETKFDKRMVIDEKSRQLFSENLKKITGEVFQFIILMINKISTIEDNGLKNFINKYILETINNYLSLQLDQEVILKFNNDYLPIINFIFQINEQNLDKYTECICNLLYLPLKQENMRNLAQIISSKILEFKNLLYKSFNTLEEEQASFFIDIFTLMVENNMEDAVKNNRLDFFQIIVDLIKKCPAKKIDIIVDFFRDFNDYLYNKNFSIDVILKNYKGLFTQMIMNFISLTQFDDLIFAQININPIISMQNNEEYNIILDFRKATSDLLKDFVINYEFEFIFSEILFPEFKNVVSKMKENPKNINNFSKFENLLFAFSSICRYINIEGPSFQNVLILFNTMFVIPKNYAQIVRSVSDIIDNCSGIFSVDKSLLLNGFENLVNGLDNELIVKYCSVSALNLLRNNKEKMSEDRKYLIDLYNNKLKSKITINQNYLYILEGLIIALTYTERGRDSYEEIKTVLDIIMSDWILILEKTKDILEKNNILSPEQNSEVNKLLLILKSIASSAFENLSSSNNKIMYDIFLQMYHNIMFIFKALSTDSDIVEKIIQLLKVYMRGLSKNFIKFLPEYIDCIINGYKLSPISSYLYGFEILMTVFRDKREEKLIKIFEELTKITFNNYIKNIFDLNIHVQIGDDFYGMLFRTMKDSPLIILESDILEDIIKTSLDYISTEQIDIAKNIMRFFTYFIKFQESNIYQDIVETDKILAEKCGTIMKTLMDKYSPLLCQKILQLYINNSVEQIIESVSELFEEFIYCNKDLAINGMKKYLPDCPKDILTNKEKETFINLIENFNNKEKEFNQFLNNFIDRCVSKQIRNRGQN